MPHALLICPEFPPSYWGYRHALGFLGKKAAMPPLGLLTVAGLFPDDWELRLVDLNTRPLEDDDLAWADAVFTSTMIVQAPSLRQVVARARAAGLPVICGGPHPTSFHAEIAASFPASEGPGCFVLGEAEDIFGELLEDLRGGTLQRLYQAAARPDLSRTPPPRFDLLKLADYGSMAVQFSRGCPFNCEFCDITQLFGRVPRTKAPTQVLAELQQLHDLGWRGAVFMVDDNFVGNRRRALELLETLAPWQAARGHPFSFYTEASVNLADNRALLEGLRDAGFGMVFLGIETPNGETLERAVKRQNTSRKTDARSHLLSAVRRIQEHGLEVTGGFIVGLDGDREFDSHLDFVREAGIPQAMTGLLSALKGTDLHDRLAREGRLLSESTGNNTDGVLNFVPELPAEVLVAEYRRVVTSLYEPTLASYFERCWTLLTHLRPAPHWSRRPTGREVLALFRSVARQLPSRQGPAYARFLLRVLRHRPRLFAEAVRLAIMGYHHERVTAESIAANDFRAALERELQALREAFAGFSRTQGERMDLLKQRAHEATGRARARHARLSRDLRGTVGDALQAFLDSVEAQVRALGASLESEPAT